MTFPEPDWRHLRSLVDRALDRFCARALDACAAVMADTNVPHHERFLRLSEAVQEHEKEMRGAFGVASRSNALLSLTYLHRLGLLTPDEMAGFSEATRERLRIVLDEHPPTPSRNR